MNSRILKKLCKRAEKYKKAFVDLERTTDNDPFECLRFDRKHKDKWCREKKAERNYIEFSKNTISYGATSGYYEPEWEDMPAYFILVSYFQDQFVDWDEYGPRYYGPKTITPTMVFKHFGI